MKTKLLCDISDCLPRCDDNRVREGVEGVEGGRGGSRKAYEGGLVMTAIGGLTHGAPVDGLDLVFVLGSVPHERQPFNSCQSADRRTDGQEERGTGDRVAQRRWRRRNQRGGGQQQEEGTEQREVVNVVTERVGGEMHRPPQHSTGNNVSDTDSH